MLPQPGVFSVAVKALVYTQSRDIPHSHASIDALTNARKLVAFRAIYPEGDDRAFAVPPRVLNGPGLPHTACHELSTSDLPD